MEERKIIYVIHELDLTDKEQTVIGVADSLENVDAIINKYYGKFEDVSFTDIRDSNLEYSKVIKLIDLNNISTYNVKIIIEWFELNEI